MRNIGSGVPWGPRARSGRSICSRRRTPPRSRAVGRAACPDSCPDNVCTFDG
jgi:hypothetical protein